MALVEEQIAELSSMKSYPKQLFYSGNLELLKKTKVSIVGSRKPSKYSRMQTHQLASTLAKYGACIVSGGAMGIDAIAHKGAGEANTIAVLPCGADIRYPAINKNLLADIEKDGLILSQFDYGFRATPWSFVVRNEVVVALGDILVVAEAQLGSGSMRSIEIALKMGKEIWVFAQRIGESQATNELLRDARAKAIYDIDDFVKNLLGVEMKENVDDDFTMFIQTHPTYEEALKRYPSKIFEAELSGDIVVVNGMVLNK